MLFSPQFVQTFTSKKYIQKQKDLKKEIVNTYFSVNGKTLPSTKFQLSDSHLLNTDRALGLLFFMEKARRQKIKFLTILQNVMEWKKMAILNTD